MIDPMIRSIAFTTQGRLHSKDIELNLHCSDVFAMLLTMAFNTGARVKIRDRQAAIRRIDRPDCGDLVLRKGWQRHRQRQEQK